jgi:carboxyl-terminal processing protease
MLYGLTDQDKYAQYYSAEAFEEENKRNNGAYDGIGVTVQTDEETGGMLVVSVNSQGPAKAAGIQVDDVIIEADGTDLTDMPLDEAISEHVKGPAGTSVVLTILRDGEKIELTVGRATIRDITVRGTMIADTAAGYISVTGFTRSTEGEFKKVWQELEESGADGLVIDLRNNGGGDMDVSLRMLDFILDDHISVSVGEDPQSQKTDGKTLLLSVEGRTGRSTEYYASDKDHHKLPVVVVVNGRSASASEIFTGVLMDYGYCSVGEKTFGKGIVQSVYRLSDNSGVKFTTDQYILPGGDKIHGVGIEPTVQVEFEEFGEVTSSLANFASGEETDILQDNQITKAVEMLEQ